MLLENTLTQETDPKYVRQRDIIPAEILNTPISLIGVGAVGGTTALFLAKTGFHNIRVYDNDTVELHNLPNSIYRMLDIGKPKVSAISEILKEFDGVEIETHPTIWDKKDIDGVYICSVDSMETRHQIWRSLSHHRSHVPLYIDARMGAEVMRIYTIDPLSQEQAELYEKTLCPPEDVMVAPCTAKATMYCASIIAGLIVSQLKKALLEQITGKQENKAPIASEIVYDVASDVFFTRQ